METSYNLAINELKQKKLVLEEEVAALIRQRDIVYNEIADQRAGKNTVFKEAYDLQQKKYDLSSQIECISKQLSSSQMNFIALTDKQKAYVKGLQDSLNTLLAKVKEFDGLDEKLEEKKSKLVKLDSDYKQKIIELSNKNSEYNNFVSEMNTKTKELEKREKYVSEKEIYIADQLGKLQKKEIQLGKINRQIVKLRELQEEYKKINPNYIFN